MESHSGSRIEYMLKAKAQFKRRSTANNVEIIVPVPDDADTPRFRTNIGSVHYVPEKSAIVWKIKQFGGGKEFLMRAELGLPSVKEADPERKKRPIQVKFEIPYFTTSGIQVRYLKIIEPKVGLTCCITSNSLTGNSCNTHLCPGSAILPKVVILPSGYQMCHRYSLHWNYCN